MDSKPELTLTLDTETPPRIDVRALNNLLDTESPPRKGVKTLTKSPLNPAKGREKLEESLGVQRSKAQLSFMKSAMWPAKGEP